MTATRQQSNGWLPGAEPAGTPEGDGGRRSLFVAPCPSPLPARDTATDAAVKIVAWTIDEDRVLRALAIRSDGRLIEVALDDLVFDHSMRPTAY